jgi:hypothetical protein
MIEEYIKRLEDNSNRDRPEETGPDLKLAQAATSRDSGVAVGAKVYGACVPYFREV